VRALFIFKNPHPRVRARRALTYPPVIEPERKKGRAATARPAPAKKRGKNESSQLKKFEHSVLKEKPAKPAKESRRVAELKQPRHVSIDERRTAEMGLSMNTTREGFEAKKRARVVERAGGGGAEVQHALATTLLPARQNQTRAALGARPGRGAAPRPEGGEMYRELLSINTELYAEREETTFPLEGLVSIGLFSAHALSLNEKQERAGVQLAQGPDFMRAQLHQVDRFGIGACGGGGGEQGGRLQPPNTMVISRGGGSDAKRRRIDDGSGGGAATDPDPAERHQAASVKLSTTLGGPVNFAFLYEKRASNEHKKYTFSEFDRGRAEIRAHFFLNDPLDDEVPYGSPPYRFKLFRELQAANYAQYKARIEAPRDAASHFPRPELEVINRAYITHYRKRPRDGEATCAHGTRCRFYLFRTDPALRYVGRVFLTPRQANAARAREEEEGDTARAASPLLCIDCLLCKWTWECVDNIANEVQQSVPMNHFSVIVGEGEYAQACMLPVRYNKLATGVVGCVPWYDVHQRMMKTVTSGGSGTGGAATEDASDPGGTAPRRKYLIDTESYVAEIGMDF